MSMIKIVTLAALVVAVAGCTSESATPPTQEVQLTSAGATASVPPDEVVASREGSSGGDEFRIEIVQFVRRDRFVNLTFKATVTKQDGSLGWQVHNSFAEVPKPSPTVDGVFLVDVKNAKKHLVALDSAGGCVCSRTQGLFVKEGGSAVFSATFAAPPAGVTSMDVHIPNAGTLSDVPLA